MLISYHLLKMFLVTNHPNEYHSIGFDVETRLGCKRVRFDRNPLWRRFGFFVHFFPWWNIQTNNGKVFRNGRSKYIYHFCSHYSDEDEHRWCGDVHYFLLVSQHREMSFFCFMAQCAFTADGGASRIHTPIATFHTQYWNVWSKNSDKKQISKFFVELRMFCYSLWATLFFYLW